MVGRGVDELIKPGLLEPVNYRSDAFCGGERNLERDEFH